MINEKIKIGAKVKTPTKGIGIFVGWAEPLGDWKMCHVVFESEPMSQRLTPYRDFDLEVVGD